MLHIEDMQTLQGADVTVMGLGRHEQGSGTAAAKWLIKHGARVLVTDLKHQDELRQTMEAVQNAYKALRDAHPDKHIYEPKFVIGEHREQDFEDVDMVVQNPGVPHDSPYLEVARDHNVPIETDITLFFRYCPFPIYAVTGTRGKSTTTALWGEMCRQSHPDTVVAGNILRSPLEDLDDLLKRDAPVPIVLELSSWQLENLADIGATPKIAVFTNIYKDHLDRYGSFDAYFNAKAGVFLNQSADQYAVLNHDQKPLRELADRLDAQVCWFSQAPFEEACGAFLEDNALVIKQGAGARTVCNVDEMALKGSHNVQNTLAAIVGAHLSSVPVSDMRAALQAFSGLPGRQEIIGTWNDVTYVNDTTATSPDGVIAALKRFAQQKNIILITGGTSKRLEYDKMTDTIRETCKVVVFLEGSATDQIKSLVGNELEQTTVGSMEAAVREAMQRAESGDVVLLAPGASSFGMFVHEFDRGDQFTQAVKSMNT